MGDGHGVRRCPHAPHAVAVTPLIAFGPSLASLVGGPFGDDFAGVDVQSMKNDLGMKTCLLAAPGVKTPSNAGIAAEVIDFHLCPNVL